MHFRFSRQFWHPNFGIAWNVTPVAAEKRERERKKKERKKKSRRALGRGLGDVTCTTEDDLDLHRPTWPQRTVWPAKEATDWPQERKRQQRFPSLSSKRQRQIRPSMWNSCGGGTSETRWFESKRRQRGRFHQGEITTVMDGNTTTLHAKHSS